MFTGLGAQSSKATTKNQASCSKFVVIGSRGSGAGPNSPDWGGGLGLPGQSFANDFKKLVGTQRVKTQYNTYEAVSILPTLDEIIGALRISPASIAGYIKAIQQALNGLGALARQSEIGAYHASVVSGETTLKQMIDQAIAACGSATKLLLTGYSQGAQLTANVYQALNTEQRQHVWGVVLFGDPRYNHLSFADTAKRDNNGILPVRGEFPIDSRDKVRSYCHARDPVCQGLGQFVLHGKGAHKRYEKADALAAAKYFAELVLTSGSPKPVPKPPDKWPTKRRDGTTVFYMWLGANFIWPDWSSCDPSYCIVGSGDTVLVFSLVQGIDQIGWVRTSIADPRAGLRQVGVPNQDIDKLLSP